MRQKLGIIIGTVEVYPATPPPLLSTFSVAPCFWAFSVHLPAVSRRAPPLENQDFEGLLKFKSFSFSFRGLFFVCVI